MITQGVFKPSCHCRDLLTQKRNIYIFSKAIRDEVLNKLNKLNKIEYIVK